ncbi:MAG: multicopper oxidase protein, partial [Verrucomicrobiaceae bacterium]|nr:multicopper oxidase protein [Verrucomicrobiaceae bacterium]
YMTMGATGMAEMGEMGMDSPANSLPMVGGPGKYDYITMGGMFTILKVRENLPADGSDPGWYEVPPGTLSVAATEEELRRDGIDPKMNTGTGAGGKVARAFRVKTGECAM